MDQNHLLHFLDPYNLSNFEKISNISQKEKLKKNSQGKRGIFVLTLAHCDSIYNCVQFLLCAKRSSALFFLSFPLLFQHYWLRLQFPRSRVGGGLWGSLKPPLLRCVVPPPPLTTVLCVSSAFTEELRMWGSKRVSTTTVITVAIKPYLFPRDFAKSAVARAMFWLKRARVDSWSQLDLHW